MLPQIEKAILKSDLEITPGVSGMIAIYSQFDRRKVRTCKDRKQKAEEGRIDPQPKGSQ